MLNTITDDLLTLLDTEISWNVEGTQANEFLHVEDEGGEEIEVGRAHPGLWDQTIGLQSDLGLDVGEAVTPSSLQPNTPVDGGSSEIAVNLLIEQQGIDLMGQGSAWDREDSEAVFLSQDQPPRATTMGPDSIAHRTHQMEDRTINLSKNPAYATPQIRVSDLGPHLLQPSIAGEGRYNHIDKAAPTASSRPAPRRRLPRTKGPIIDTVTTSSNKKLIGEGNEDRSHTLAESTLLPRDATHLALWRMQRNRGFAQNAFYPKNLAKELANFRKPEYIRKTVLPQDPPAMNDATGYGVRSTEPTEYGIRSIPASPKSENRSGHPEIILNDQNESDDFIRISVRSQSAESVSTGIVEFAQDEPPDQGHSNGNHSLGAIELACHMATTD